MKKFTTTEFAKRFPDDDACLHHLFTLTYGKMEVCPQCKAKADFKKVKDRRSYQCSQCSYQVYPTKGTPFEKTTTPLLYWFWAIYMFTTTRNGVAAKELERQFNICYKTALRMAHQIKKLIANRVEVVMTGIVEVDELRLGGKMKNKHKWQREQMRKDQTHKDENKTIVFGMVERNGEVVTRIVDSVHAEVLQPLILEKVAEGSIVVSDDFTGYRNLKKSHVKHYAVNHSQDEFVRGILHTNSIEGLWSIVRRTIEGTHISVSRKHLQKYLDECAFRYKMRERQNEMFDAILANVSPSA